MRGGPLSHAITGGGGTDAKPWAPGRPAHTHTHLDNALPQGGPRGWRQVDEYSQHGVQAPGARRRAPRGGIAWQRQRSTQMGRECGQQRSGDGGGDGRRARPPGRVTHTPRRAPGPTPPLRRPVGSFYARPRRRCRRRGRCGRAGRGRPSCGPRRTPAPPRCRWRAGDRPLPSTKRWVPSRTRSRPPRSASSTAVAGHDRSWLQRPWRGTGTSSGQKRAQTGGDALVGRAGGGWRALAAAVRNGDQLITIPRSRNPGFGEGIHSFRAALRITNLCCSPPPAALAALHRCPPVCAAREAGRTSRAARGPRPAPRPSLATSRPRLAAHRPARDDLLLSTIICQSPERHACAHPADDTTRT